MVRLDENISDVLLGQIKTNNYNLKALGRCWGPEE
jgi:hypothetical protein